MHFQEIKPTPQAAQHAERKHIDFHQANDIDVVLIPLDEGALLHGGVGDGHRFVEWSAGKHEAADMLREMAREPDQLIGEINSLPDRRIVGIEPGLANVFVR